MTLVQLARHAGTAPGAPRSGPAIVGPARSDGQVAISAGPAAALVGPVRVRPAELRDMARLEPVINGYARQGLMLPKTSEQLHRHFREFTVAVDDTGALLGCVALRVYGPELAEVSALAVAEAARGRGVGGRLLEALEAQARGLGLHTLFALTLEQEFFHRFGFRPVAREQFPLKVALDCGSCSRRQQCREVTVAKRLNTTSDGLE